MRRFIVGFLAFIGGLFCLLIGATAALMIWAAPGAPPVPANAVLTLNLNQAFPEMSSTDPLTRILGEEQLSLRDALDAIERASDDPRVKVLFARLGGDGMGLAQVQELRDAVIAFRAKGKFAVAFADTFGEFGPGTRSYYLASAFDKIWLQPQGLVGLTGLRAEAMFFRGTLDKLDVQPRFDHRSEYKTAMNAITERSMTPAHREETEALLKSIFAQIVSGIAAGRGIDEAQVRELVNRAPLLEDEARSAHIVDEIGYRDDADAAARAHAGAGAETVSLGRYLAAIARPHQSGPVVALIYGTGFIQRGSSASGPLSGSLLMGADTVAHAFEQAKRDPAVKAILFRIDSPGGSAVASETIWRAVVRAHEAGKPVIVSMGDVAGSGGYYIAAGADKIVAEPSTLTGSIGVVAGKFLTAGLWEKAGVTWDAVNAGENAAMFSTLEDFSPAAHARFEKFLDAVYADFKDRVAKGRKLDDATVESLAKGRVWTGADAKDRGLVDALGGYATALQLVKQAINVPPAGDVTLKLFPPPETPRQLLSRVFGNVPDEGDASSGGLGTLAAALRQIQVLLQQIEVATAPPGSLTMPPVTTH